MMTPGLRRLTLGLLVLGGVCAVLGDVGLIATDPGSELLRLFQGLLMPDFLATERLFEALFATVAFALLGVTLGAVAGAMLAPLYHHRLVRYGCGLLRSVHELFWALLLMQLFGLSGLTGVLALAIPFSAMFARIYSDLLAQAPATVEQALPYQTRWLDRLLYGRLAPMWPALASYTRYRFECAIRSATVLGFLGLPTLGFYLESAFRQGFYGQGGALLWLLLLLIGTLRWWGRPAPLLLLLALSLWWLPPVVWPGGQWFVQFLTEGIWPAPLLQGDWAGLWQWASGLFPLAADGLVNTLLVSGLALAISLVLTLLQWPWASRSVMGHASIVGQGVLLFGRSLPELWLAFVLMLVLGPSALPAALALALHNGALVAFLTAREADRLTLRPDAPRGWNRHHYELLPRVYPGMVNLLMYRFESMVRETAMMGMLGIATLGFYVDSAFELFRFDEAMALILLSGLLNLLVEGVCRRALSTR
ncbi:ABC transporter permease [Ferrimonas balearica]|nr:ABC transporter permease [Ferrimonas balearica]